MWATAFLKHSRFLDQQGSWDSTSNADQVFLAFQDSFRGFEKVCGFEVMDGKWISMIVDHMTELLVQYAEEADYEAHQNLLNPANGNARSAAMATQESSKHQKVEKALSLMESLFRKLIHGTKNPPDYRKFASFYLTLHLIRVNFSINNFKFTDAHFKFIERVDTQEINMLPKAWHVQVAYYKGRYYMYNNNFVAARDELVKAFGMSNSDPAATENKKRILRYLIPVEMINGRFPSRELLERYGLVEYIDVTVAAMKGDMQALEQCISQNMDLYIQSGVFTVIERLRMVTLKNFVKRVANAVKVTPELQVMSKDTLVNLNLLYVPLREWDDELDLDELQCLLANLIANGLIKGYISHEKRILVLSKDAFPEAGPVMLSGNQSASR